MCKLEALVTNGMREVANKELAPELDERAIWLLTGTV